MNILLLIYLITYPICAVVCAGLFYAHMQRAFPAIAKQERRQDSGIAILFGAWVGHFNVVGVFVALCLSGFAEHGFKLPFTR